MMKSSRSVKRLLVGLGFIWPSIIGLGVFVIYPAIMSVYYSMTNWNGWDLPVWVGWDNFIKIFTGDVTTWLSWKATAIYVLFSVPLSLFIGLGLAILINRKLPGLKIFRTAIYLPVVLPLVSMIVLWKFVYSPKIGLLNQLLALCHIKGPIWLGDPNTVIWALIIIGIWGGLWGIGNSMIIFLAALQTVPEEIYEAAKVDHANAWQTFCHITFPMITPVFFLQLVNGLIVALQTFAPVRVLYYGTGGQNGVVGVAGPQNSALLWMVNIYQNGFDNHQFGYAEAQVLLLVLVILIFTILLFRSQSSWVHYENDVE